jgi:hypothetical protein
VTKAAARIGPADSGDCFPVNALSITVIGGKAGRSVDDKPYYMGLLAT